MSPSRVGTPPSRAGRDTSRTRALSARAGTSIGGASTSRSRTGSRRVGSGQRLPRSFTTRFTRTAPCSLPGTGPHRCRILARRRARRSPPACSASHSAFLTRPSACAARHPAHRGGAQLSAGGCQPTRAQRPRATITRGWFRWSAMTVARPIAVSPSTRVASALHVKWSLQRCVRGWKSGTVYPVNGSSATMAAALCSLHAEHAWQTFSNEVAPPFERGTM